MLRAAWCVGILATFMACGSPASKQPPQTKTAPGPVYATEQARFRIVPITEQLKEPWGFAFLPDGDILVTERLGRLRLIHGGRLQPQPIGGVPNVETKNEAGLMDIALHPRFAQNRQIYLTYSKLGERGNTPALARASVEGSSLPDLQDIFVSDAWSAKSGGNAGSRVVFGPDETLYMSIGDRHQQEPAQDMQSDKGKIVRLRDDGSIPDDNPFVGRPKVRPEIFAFGVRNPQGLFVDRTTGTIWENEHGPLGGDELNILLPGRNYGWPLITYGKNYNGTTISNETSRKGMEQPLAYWVPSISPSGLTVYTGDMFPGWRGNVFIGALSGAHLRRIVVERQKVVHEEALTVRPLRTRIRDVRQGPDGCLYVLTERGALLRVEPER